MSDRGILYQQCESCGGSGVRPGLTWSGSPRCPGCDGSRFVAVGITLEMSDRLFAAAQDLAAAVERARVFLRTAVDDPDEAADELESVLDQLDAAIGPARGLLVRAGGARPRPGGASGGTPGPG